MAAVRPGVNGMYGFKRDITKFHTSAAVFEVQQYGETYDSRDDQLIKGGRH